MVKKSTARRAAQVEKFREAARELEADDSEERFDAALKKIAKAPKALPQKSNDDKPKRSR